MPRWVKAFVVAAALIILVLVGTKLLGVDHGPRRHGGGGHVPAVGHHG